MVQRKNSDGAWRSIAATRLMLGNPESPSGRWSCVDSSYCYWSRQQLYSGVGGLISSHSALPNAVLAPFYLAPALIIPAPATLPYDAAPITPAPLPPLTQALNRWLHGQPTLLPYYQRQHQHPSLWSILWPCGWLKSSSSLHTLRSRSSSC